MVLPLMGGRARCRVGGALRLGRWGVIAEGGDVGAPPRSRDGGPGEITPVLCGRRAAPLRELGGQGRVAAGWLLLRCGDRDCWRWSGW